MARRGTRQGGKTNFDFAEVEALVRKRDLRDCYRGILGYSAATGNSRRDDSVTYYPKPTPFLHFQQANKTVSFFSYTLFKLQINFYQFNF